MDCGGSGRECHHFLAGSDEVLEVFLKRVDVGSERHDPVSVESLLDILHFHPAHMSDTEVDARVHGIYLNSYSLSKDLIGLAGTPTTSV